MAIREFGEQAVDQPTGDDLDLDPGAPFTHSLQADIAEAAADKGGKDDKPGEVDKGGQADSKVADLQSQIDSLRAESLQNKRDAEYWSNFAKNNQPRAAAPVAEAEEPDDDTAEALLDDLSSLGAAALSKRGYVKLADVERLVDSRINQTVEEVQSGQQFDAMLNTDFPELRDEQSDMFKRTQVHFRDMVAIDPAARTSRVTLLAAAKMAKHEITTKAELDGARDDGRRERIDRQRGTTGARPEQADSDPLRTSPIARELASKLGRFIDADKNKVFSKVAEFRGSPSGRGSRTGS